MAYPLPAVKVEGTACCTTPKATATSLDCVVEKRLEVIGFAPEPIAVLSSGLVMATPENWRTSIPIWAFEFTLQVMVSAAFPMAFAA
jgi:hypothetical protein